MIIRSVLLILELLKCFQLGEQFVVKGFAEFRTVLFKKRHWQFKSSIVTTASVALDRALEFDVCSLECGDAVVSLGHPLVREEVLWLEVLLKL